MNNPEIEEYVRSLVFNERDLETIRNILEYIEITFLNGQPINPVSLKIAVSSGNSYVIIIEELDFVFQYYPSPFVYNRVAGFIDGMNNTNINKNINISRGFGQRKVVEADFNIQYDLRNYLVFDFLKLPQIQTIIWPKVIAINSIVGIHDRDPTFINNNLDKILWDLGKSLWGIHQNGFIHGDGSLDNSGILNETKFAYFDYDSSRDLSQYDMQDAYNLMKQDNAILLKSINFQLDLDLQPVFGKYGDFLTNVLKWVKSQHNFATYEEALAYLENLTIHI